MKKFVIVPILALVLTAMGSLSSVCFAKSALTYFGTVVDVSDLPEPTREEILREVAVLAKKEVEGSKTLVYANDVTENQQSDFTGEVVKTVSSLHSLIK